MGRDSEADFRVTETQDAREINPGLFNDDPTDFRMTENEPKKLEINKGLFREYSDEEEDVNFGNLLKR